MPSSVTRLTSLDHQRLLRLLRRAVTDGPSQERWRDELLHLLAAHRLAEDRTLTADVVEAAGPTAAAAAEAIGRVNADIDRLAEELCASRLPSDGLGDLGDRLRALIEEHAALLAGQVLEPLESAVPRKEIRRLGGVYETFRDEDLRERGDGEPPPRRFDLPRAELYELARRAGIEGRSAMSRGDLIAELQRRSAHT